MIKLLNRILARIIDSLLFGIICLLAFIPVHIFKNNNILSIWIFVTYLSIPIYGIFMHVLFGQTLGKVILSIKLTNFNFLKVKPHIIVIREIFVFNILYFNPFYKLDYNPFYLYLDESIINVIAIIIILIDISPYFFNKDKKLLHDIILKTLVIENSHDAQLRV